MSRRIHLLIGAHLSTAPRAQKEALALMAAGFEVEISGVWHDESAAARDQELMRRNGLRFRPALDFRGGRPRAELRRARVRLQARWARERFRRTGRFSPRLLGYGAPELLRQAETSGAELTIAHSEAGLWAVHRMLGKGHRVGVDFEDWFSRDLPPEARRERPVQELEKLERSVAREARYVVAPSQAMSAALARAYGIPAPPVVYNSFPATEHKPSVPLQPERCHPHLPSLHWFSQVVGPHRGLENLIAAMPLLKSPAVLHLRGNCAPSVKSALLKSLYPTTRVSVVFLPPVPAEELPFRIAEHDIGLALESTEIPSRDLTVANKLFQYLQAGLAVIATDTQGQREVLVRCGRSGLLLRDSSPAHIAHAIDSLLEDPERLAQARRDAPAAAEGPFAWEHSRAKIVAQAARALE